MVEERTVIEIVRESARPIDDIDEISPTSVIGLNRSIAASAIPIGLPIEFPEFADAVDGRVALELNEFKFT